MRRCDGQSNSPLLSSAASTSPRSRGYALLVLMMMVTILLISLTAALPSIYVAGQREREEELIFRGTEYARAIGLFRRRFQRFPTSVEELLNTNGIRFLRRAYPDPMSRNGKWRFIHADATGALIDSETQALASPPAGDQSKSPPGVSLEDKGRPRAIGRGTSEMQGAFIAGVASSSRRESIRVWNGRTHYDEWEFIAVESVPLGGQPAGPGQPLGPGQQQVPRIPVMPPLTEGPIPRQ